jgi:hypothetical protein
VGYSCDAAQRGDGVGQFMAVADQGDAKSFEFPAVSRGNASGSMALSPNTCRRRLIAMPDLPDAAQIVGTRADRVNQCREIIASDEKRDRGSMLTPDLTAGHFRGRAPLSSREIACPTDRQSLSRRIAAALANAIGRPDREVAISMSAARKSKGRRRGGGSANDGQGFELLVPASVPLAHCMGYLNLAKSKAGALASCSFVKSVTNPASGAWLLDRRVRRLRGEDLPRCF